MSQFDLNAQDVYNKYETIYGGMLELFEAIEVRNRFTESYSLELLDLLLFGWNHMISESRKGVKASTIEDFYQAYQRNKEINIKYLLNGNQIKNGNFRSSCVDLSSSYIQFATCRGEGFDVLIELGGGCGHNLVRSFHELNNGLRENTHFINAEYSPKGRELSDKLFERYGMSEEAFSVEFDYNNSEKSIELLKPFIQGKDVIIYTASSLEQIPLVDKSFFEMLERLARLSKTFTISFCEPIAWQLTGTMPRYILNNSHEGSHRIGLNRNLYSSVLDWVDCSENGIFIHTICPSIFFNGYHISGIKVKSCNDLKSFTWTHASKNNVASVGDN